MSGDQAEGSYHDHFLRLWAAHEQSIRVFLRTLLPPNGDVEDLAQDVLTVCWRKFDMLDSPDGFAAWIKAIARFEAHRYRRRYARDRHVFTEELWELLADEASTDWQRREAERQRFVICLRHLEEGDRQLVLSLHTPGTSVAQVARDRGVDTRPLYSKVEKICSGLLRCMKQSHTEGEPE